MNSNDQRPPVPTPHEALVLHEVLLALRRTRHGAIQLQIQDARVVQVDVTEKRRL